MLGLLVRESRDRNWLAKKLSSAGISGPENVYLMMVNGADQVYVAPKEDAK